MSDDFNDLKKAVGVTYRKIKSYSANIWAAFTYLVNAAALTWS